MVWIVNDENSSQNKAIYQRSDISGSTSGVENSILSYINL